MTLDFSNVFPDVYRISWDQGCEVVTSPGGGMSVLSKLVPTTDPRNYILDRWQELRQLPPVEEFIRAFSDTAIGAPSRAPGIRDVQVDEAGVRSWIDGFFQDTLANMGTAAGAERPTDAMIESFWRGAEQWFFGNEIDTVESGFLAAFDSEVSDIDFSDGLRLHRLSNKELARWIEQAQRRHGIDAFDAKWRVTWEYRATRDEYGEGRTPSRIDALRLALRLVKPGNVWLRFWGRTSKYPISGYGGMIGRSEDKRPAGNQYRLLASEVDELKRLVEKSTASNFARFSPAKRFEDSYHEHETPERLVDLVIALEGLFAPEKDDSISYRLAMRAAKMLALPGEDPHRLFRWLKGVYGLRSTLLHGGDLGSDGRAKKLIAECGHDLWDVVKKVEELVRTALKERLHNPERFQQEALDTLLLA